jgi:hypothetical protein
VPRDLGVGESAAILSNRSLVRSHKTMVIRREWQGIPYRYFLTRRIHEIDDFRLQRQVEHLFLTLVLRHFLGEGFKGLGGLECVAILFNCV